MDLNALLSVVVFASMVTSSSAVCELKKGSIEPCNSTVICSKVFGHIVHPNCGHVQPYFKFYITDFNVEHVNQGYFSATNFDASVREIIAFGNNWSYITPNAFRYYPKTIRMDISKNNILEVKEEAFESLSHLVFLNISNNNIETLYSTSFAIANKRYDSPLLELDISNNKLLELSSQVNELSRLKRLHLQNNLLKIIADVAFMRLGNLEYLNLRNNSLTALNITLTNLKMLRILDISYNNMIKLSGYEINRLVALVDFNVSHNALTSIESNCFNQASSLQMIDFSYNKINTNIENMFINNNKLNYINFYNNDIKGLQENSFKNCNLNYINLGNNNIAGDIKENYFIGLQNITKLDLSRQRIDGIRNNAFKDITGLQYLNLSTNNIENIENSSFVDTNLTVLDLSFNKITDLNFLQNCLTNLVEFYINNNNIAILPNTGFENQMQIKKIDLSMNSIKNIEQYTLPLKSLQYLNIRGNSLNAVVSENVFSPAKYLRCLDLSNTNIMKINDLALVDLTALGQLNLSNNQIETIGPINFKGVDNMFSLDISYNKLSKLTFNNKNMFKNLKTLYLNNNNLSNISSLILNKSKLSYIDLTNNNIGNTFNFGANILPNLTVLHLANNKIEIFNNPQTNTLTSLIDLGLSSNNISNINLSYFKELISVDLSYNNLSYLNSTLFKNNEYLQSLDISRNNITDFPPGTFQFMKNLKLLNLSCNYLTKLRFGSLRGLHKTELLDLSWNNIATLDVNVFHECNELKTLIIDYNRIKTLNVERLILISLKNLTTLSLGGNPISCTEIIHNIKSTNDTIYAVRQVEVTSIDKIYHEDNVHGIKCGDDVVINETTTVQSDLIKSTGNKTDSSPRIIINHTGPPTTHPSTIIIISIWCSLLTILLAAVGAIIYVKVYKKRGLVVSSSMTMQMRNSIELNGSDFQDDLLS